MSSLSFKPWFGLARGWVAAACLLGADLAGAATLRIASAFDPQTMDPHALDLDLGDGEGGQRGAVAE